MVKVYYEPDKYWSLHELAAKPSVICAPMPTLVACGATSKSSNEKAQEKAIVTPLATPVWSIL